MTLPRSHKGRWRRVLQLLADAGGTLPRAEIKERIEPLSESHLSHLLRDLEDAGLARRHRPDRCREVLVQLLPAGRELVAAGAADSEPSTDDEASADWAPWLS